MILQSKPSDTIQGIVNQRVWDNLFADRDSKREKYHFEGTPQHDTARAKQHPAYPT